MDFTTDLLMFFAFIAGALIGLLTMYLTQLRRLEEYQDRIEELNSIIFKDDKKK